MADEEAVSFANASDPATPSAATTAAGTSGAIAQKRAYRSPVLQRIGSVRELTLGATSGKAEGAGTLHAVM